MLKTYFLVFVISLISSVKAMTQDRIIVEKRYLTEIPQITNATFYPWRSPMIKGIYYDGPEYGGKNTKVFAYLGIPKVKRGTKVPGIVLVHGGGGTAFRDWVDLWVSRGYAAIAMDTCGCIPVRTVENCSWMRQNSSAGPFGWDASFNQVNEPLENQWPYYAVNAIARARTLLGSLPEVDNSKIGITGVSWGGYLTCLVAATDSRYLFAAPIYGCGFLSFKSAWMDTLRKPEKAAWNEKCDPSKYLQQVSMPILWVAGTNDGAYPLESLQKSADLVRSPVTLSITLRMPHGHGGAGELPEIIRVYADYFCKNKGIPLPEITSVKQQKSQLVAKVKTVKPILYAKLLYTQQSGKWDKLEWKSAPAVIAANGKTVSVTVPEGAKQYILNIQDERNLTVSSRLFLR
jgi:dienelactone hydrolase